MCLILVLEIHTDSPALPVGSLPAGSLPVGVLPVGALPVGVQIEEARRTHTEEGEREERERISMVTI